MSFTYKKKTGPSILSLKHAKSKSQTQSQPDQFEKILKDSSKSDTSAATEINAPHLESSKTKLTKIYEEMEHLDSSSYSPLKIAVVNLDSSDDDTKPVRHKRTKAAPDLKKLADIKQDAKNEVEAKSCAAAESENSEPGAKKVKMEEIASRLKVFEKPATGKIAVKEIECKPKSAPKKSAEANVASTVIHPPGVTSACNKEPAKSSTGVAKMDLPCPVCNRNFKRNLRGHMKACAGKNGLTTEQLMLALELQRKQEEERQRLGLPQYLVNNKKPTVSNKKSGKESDPNIQLALALSKSLKEAEEEAYLREARMVLENQDDMTESQVAAAIKAVTSEPEISSKGIQTTLAAVEAGQLGIKKAPVNASSSRTGPPPFATTSAEERLRRVTEKVAMCLLEEDTADQYVQKQPALRCVEVSDELKGKLEEGSGLWELASISSEPEKGAYYVQGLREFVSPSSSNSGVLNLKPMLPTYPKPKDHVVKKRAHIPSVLKPPSPVKKTESTLGRDWASILNSKTMSDIVVYVKDDVELRAHKLVLLVRCPAILKDLAAELSQDGRNVKEHMLLLSEYSESVVMAALEFVYCDSTCRAVRLKNKDVQDLEELAQRYELFELLSHLEMMKKLRNEVQREDEQIKSNTPRQEPAEPEPSPLVIDASESRTELSYLVSQMDKSTFSATLVPTSIQTKVDESKEASSAKVSILHDSKRNIDPEVDINTARSSQNSQIDKEDGQAGESNQNQSQSDDDLFASLHDSKIYNDLMDDNMACNLTEQENIEPVEDNDFSEDWRNLDGLDYLDATPKRSKSAAALPQATPLLDCEEQSMNTANNFETSPFSSPAGRPSSELEVVTLSSDSVSQKSTLSISPKVIVHTPEHHPLDDSIGVLDDGELTHLELAALKAYEKVMTPKPPSRAASTPSSSRITPMLDYSIMESPQLQKELDRYGIKHLRRNQAKLILRHIYNELHPKLASTPLARPFNKTKKALELKPKKNQTQKGVPEASTSKVTQPPTRKTTPKKSTPVKEPATRQPVHNMSFAPSDEEYDSFDELLFDRPKRKSMSQPAIQRSSDSDSSNSSDNEGYGKYHGDDDLEDMFTQQITDTQSDKPTQIEEALRSDPGLYHRILTYEPIWLEEIKDLLKANKVRVNPKFLLDFLDDQCITYRTDHQRPVKRAAQKRGWTQSQRGRKKKDLDL